MAHVAKSDDNVEVDLDTLTSVLRAPGRGAGQGAGLVTCPTLCYGMRVIREARAGMTGNWSHSAAEGGHTLTNNNINMMERMSQGMSLRELQLKSQKMSITHIYCFS